MPDDLNAEAVGEVETEDKILVLKRIHVRYHLAGDVDRDKVARVHEVHARSCPVARSLQRAIAITTELVMGS